MKDCKKCQHFYDSGKEYHCYALRTYCAPIDTPNLGKELGGCGFVPLKKDKEVKDELQA